MRSSQTSDTGHRSTHVMSLLTLKRIMKAAQQDHKIARG